MRPPRRRLAFVAVCTRGAGVSVYDYADFSETHLGLRQPILVCMPSHELGTADPIYRRLLRSMQERFGRENVRRLPSWPPATTALDAIITAENVTDVYIQKMGVRDGVMSTVSGVRNLIHAVLDGQQPHGDAYARNSPSVLGSAPVVPHIVRPPRLHAESDLRRQLGIAANATVFCRHGGPSQFNLRVAQEAVVEAARRRPELVFLFHTTNAFCHHFTNGSACSPNIRHVDESIVCTLRLAWENALPDGGGAFRLPTCRPSPQAVRCVRVLIRTSLTLFERATRWSMPGARARLSG